MEEENRKDRRPLIVLITLMICVICMGIGYTTLSTTIKIVDKPNNTTPMFWNIKFKSENESVNTGETKIINGILSQQENTTTVSSCGTANLTTDKITINKVNLSDVGSSCEYKLKVENIGTIDAKLTEIVPIVPAGISCKKDKYKIICDNIEYKLQINSKDLDTNLNIYSNQEKNISLVIKKLNDETTKEIQAGVGFTLIYNEL